MEQMIVPRLAGPHVPGCFGSGSFERQPYVVIERIPGKTLYDRLGDLPLGYEEARVIAGKMPSGYHFVAQPNEVAGAVLSKSTWSVTLGRAPLVTRIVPATLKLIVSAPGWLFASSIACRSEPAPLSLRLATAKVLNTFRTSSCS